MAHADRRAHERFPGRVPTPGMRSPGWNNLFHHSQRPAVAPEDAAVGGDHPPTGPQRGRAKRPARILPSEDGWVRFRRNVRHPSTECTRPSPCATSAACCSDEFTEGVRSNRPETRSSDWGKRDGNRLPTLRVLRRQLS
jgi:hypothetical protein